MYGSSQSYGTVSIFTTLLGPELAEGSATRWGPGVYRILLGAGTLFLLAFGVARAVVRPEIAEPFWMRGVIAALALGTAAGSYYSSWMRRHLGRLFRTCIYLLVPWSIGFMVEQMAHARKQGDTLGDMFRGVGSSLLGAGGVVLGVQALVSWGPKLIEFFRGSGKGASEFAKRVDKAAESVIQLGGNLSDMSVTVESELGLEQRILAAGRAIDELREQGMEEETIMTTGGPSTVRQFDIDNLTESERRRLQINRKISDQLQAQLDRIKAQRSIRNELGSARSLSSLFAGTGGPKEFGPLPNANINLGGVAPNLAQVEGLRAWNKELSKARPQIRQLSKQTVKWAEAQQKAGVFTPELAKSTKLAQTAFQQLGNMIGQAAVRLDSFKSVGRSALNVLQGVIGQFVGAGITGGLGSLFGLGSFKGLAKGALGLRAHGAPVVGGRP